ncbi:MAG: hypothetical protein WDN76_05680 [Alphaproteobacteria bacterium]
MLAYASDMSLLSTSLMPHWASRRPFRPFRWPRSTMRSGFTADGHEPLASLR